MIYFIQAGEGGPIKIGYSRDALKRIANLQAASPVLLSALAIIPGEIRDEFALHRRLQSERLHGEWFRPSDAVLDAATNPPSPMTPPPRRGIAKHPRRFAVPDPPADMLGPVRFRDDFVERPGLPPPRQRRETGPRLAFDRDAPWWRR
jgi:hypothetical protein